MVAPMPLLQPVTHPLFYMNGLLLDIEWLYSVEFQEICDHYEKQYTRHVKSLFMDTKALGVALIIIYVLQLPMPKEELVEESQMKLKEVLLTAALMPAVEKLIYHWQKYHMPLAVVISSGFASFEMKASRHKKFFSWFDCIILVDDPKMRNGKPDPDIFLLAYARGLSPPPVGRMCLIFEDAHNGAEVALAARMQVVMVPDRNLH